MARSAQAMIAGWTLAVFAFMACPGSETGESRQAIDAGAATSREADAPASSHAKNAAPDGAQLPVHTVVGVHDGDTIRVASEGQELTVRLTGVDAPELEQEGGREARSWLETRTFGREVVVKIERHDRYGRALAEVFLEGGESVNLALVRAGMAWHFTRYSGGAMPGRSDHDRAWVRGDHVGWANEARTKSSQRPVLS